jgi:hypothetical protein
MAIQAQHYQAAQRVAGYAQLPREQVVQVVQA